MRSLPIWPCSAWPSDDARQANSYELINVQNSSTFIIRMFAGLPEVPFRCLQRPLGWVVERGRWSFCFAVFTGMSRPRLSTASQDVLLRSVRVAAQPMNKHLKHPVHGHHDTQGPDRRSALCPVRKIYLLRFKYVERQNPGIWRENAIAAQWPPIWLSGTILEQRDRMARWAWRKPSYGFSE